MTIYFYIFSGMAVQGRDDSKNKNSKEAQEIMDKILSQASSNDPSKKQSPKYFSGSGMLMLWIKFNNFLLLLF